MGYHYGRTHHGGGAADGIKEHSRMGISVIFTIGIVAVAWGLSSYHKQKTFKNLLGHLQRGEYDAYYDLLEAPLTKFHYPKFNRQFMKLNGLIAQGRHHTVEEQLQELLDGKATADQRRELVLKAFDYYVGRKKKRQAQELLQEIRSWNEPATSKACERLYDIILLGSSEHIAEMEAELAEKESPSERQYMEILLAMQYKSKGDKEKEQEYLKRAEEDLSAADGK